MIYCIISKIDFRYHVRGEERYIEDSIQALEGWLLAYGGNFYLFPMFLEK